MKFNRYKCFVWITTILEFVGASVLMIFLFRYFDKELKDMNVAKVWEVLWYIVKMIVSFSNVYLTSVIYKELVKKEDVVLLFCNELKLFYHKLKQRLNVNVWQPFQKNVKTSRFWYIQLFNWVKIQRFYLRCVLKAIAWLLLMSIIKQGLFVNELSSVQSEVLFSGVLTTMYALLVFLVAVKVVLVAKEVTSGENPPSWKYRKQLLHWIIVLVLFLKYKVFTVATYDSITRNSNLLEVVEPFYSEIFSYGLILICLFLVRKRFRMTIDYVETLSGKPLLQSEFGTMLHVQEKWQPFLHLFSLSETYYGDVSYQKQIIKDEYIDPRVGKEQIVTISIRYSPFKETFVLRRPFIKANIQGNCIGYAVGRKKESQNKNASEAL